MESTNCCLKLASALTCIQQCTVYYPLLFLFFGNLLSVNLPQIIHQNFKEMRNIANLVVTKGNLWLLHKDNQLSIIKSRLRQSDCSIWITINMLHLAYWVTINRNRYNTRRKNLHHPIQFPLAWKSSNHTESCELQDWLFLSTLIANGTKFMTTTTNYQ